MNALAPALRAVMRGSSRRLDQEVQRIVFESRARPECVTCGAELQGARCPWSKASAVPASDGRTYCDWPRSKPRPGPMYTITRSRQGPPK